MRAHMRNLLASFLILFTVVAGACAHSASTVPPIAPDQGRSGGNGGGGGGY